MVVYTVFKINQDEIAKTICIQRKQQFNTCNGRCELQKSLKKYDDNEKRMDNNLKEKQELVYIQNIIAENFTAAEPIISQQKLFACATDKPVSVAISTFRPPTFFI